jgi:hypothetical protein
MLVRSSCAAVVSVGPERLQLEASVVAAHHFRGRAGGIADELIDGGRPAAASQPPARQTGE